MPMSLPDRLLALLTRRHDYVTVFGTPSGQRVLKDLVEFSGIMTALPIDNLERAAGRRDVGLHITTILHMTPDEIRRTVTVQSQPGDDDD